jgi:anti-sigma factor RsiW
MNGKHGAISEMEIDAYLNDQLDLAGRAAVESVLAEQPALAARVMADLRIRNILRAEMLAGEREPDPRLALAAKRLQRGLGRSRANRAARQAVMAAACVLLGWLVHWQVGSVGVAPTEAASPPPRFVSEAVQAYRTSQLRAVMLSQPEAPTFDRQEILDNTAIALPPFPEDWRILDVQVYPAALGSSVVVMLQTPTSAPLSLYLVRLRSDRSIPLRLSRDGEQRAFFWQQGRTASALTGQGSASELRKVAVVLAGS